MPVSDRRHRRGVALLVLVPADEARHFGLGGKPVNGLEISFMRRVYPVSALLTGVAFLCALAARDLSTAVGVLAGGLFGILNTALLARVITAAVRPGDVDPIEIAVTALVKFPIALGFLILVLWRGWVDPLGFLWGFPMIFVGALAVLIWHFYFGEGSRSSKADEAS